MKKIQSIAALKQESLYNDSTGLAEFFILLCGGIRSSKRIVYYPETNRFDVHNDINNIFQKDLTEEELSRLTNIVPAMERGAFYKY
jgi:hypothetical protein